MTLEEVRCDMRLRIEADIQIMSEDLAAQRGVPINDEIREYARYCLWDQLPTQTKAFIEAGLLPDFAN